MNKKIVFAFLMVLLSCIAYSQYSDLSYINLNPSHGLSDKEVTCITQDFRDFIWIGTINGLNRYDGSEIKAYTYRSDEPGSLRDNYIRCILEDSQKRLWVCTGKGLHLYDRVKDRFISYSHKDGDSSSLGNDLVSVIYEDRMGNLWAGHFDGFAKMHIIADPNSTMPKHISFENHPVCSNSTNVLANWVYSFCDDDNGNIWIGTFRYDVVRYTPKTRQLRKYPVNTDTLNLINDSRHWVRKIVRDKQGDIWALLMNDMGIAYYDKKNDRFVALKIKSESDREQIGFNTLYDIFIDNTNTFFLATGYGLRILTVDKTTAIPQFNYIPDFYEGIEMRAVYIDKHNGIWIGNAGTGLDYADRNQFRYSIINNANFKVLTSNSVSYFQHGIDDVFYIELKDKSWYKYSIHNLSLTHEKVVDAIWTNYNRTAELFRKEGRLFYRNQKTSIVLPDSIGTMVQIKLKNNGEIVAIGKSGLVIYNPFTKKSKLLVDLNTVNQIFQTDRTIFLDAKDRIWIKSAYNLFQISSKGTIKNTLPNFDFSSFTLMSDSTGNIWLSYYNKLYCYSSDSNKLSLFNQDHGFNGNNIYALVCDRQNNIWMSTNKGISRFDVAAKQFYNFGEGDGLPYMNYTSLVRKDRNGKLYFGSLNGILIIDPNKIVTNPNIPKIILTGFRLFNRDVSVKPDSFVDKNVFYLTKQIGETDELVLRYDQNVISISYAALNFTNSSKNNYAYYLEGLEKEWNYVGSKRIADYSGLQPGTYVFKVKGSNNSSVWNEEGISLRIEILPPFWRTWWFSTLLLLIVMFGVILVFQLRMRAMKEQKESLEQQVKERTSEIQTQADNLKVLNSTKDKFFSIIAHDLKNPLYSIAGIAELMDVQYFTMDESTKQKFIKGIRDSSKNVSSLLENLLQWARTQTNNIASIPENITITAIAEENISLLRSNAENKKIILENKTQPDHTVYADKNMITTVVRNLINNAIKFTPEGGTISVESIIREEVTEIIVADTGIGISESVIQKLFRIDQHITNQGTAGEAGTGLGLIICKEFIDKNKGNIRVESEPGKGSRFIISLPTGSNMSSTVYPNTAEIKTDKIIEVSKQEIQLPLRNDDSPVVLLVEDNEGIRKNLKENIEKYFNFIEAVNGKDGLAKAFSEMPDIIISDWMMPEMEGIELLNILKHDERTSHIPLILLTAKDEIQDKIEGLETGADDYLTKPFNTQEILLRINNQFESRRRLRERVMKDLLINTKDLGLNTTDDHFLQKAITLVENHIEDSEFDISHFTKEIGLSRSQLHKKLTAITNQSATEFIRTIRLKKAAQLISEGLNVSEVYYRVGFNDRRYFTRVFAEQFGVPPSEYKMKK